MSKIHQFTVNLAFEDKIYSDDDINEIKDNIAKAIINQSNNEGISPENSETFLNSVEVSNGFVEGVVVKMTH